MSGRLKAKFAVGFLVVAILLFLPAGTLARWRVWLPMGILFVPTFVAGLVMLSKAPNLLRHRLEAREKETEQRAVVALTVLMCNYLSGNKSLVLHHQTPCYCADVYPQLVGLFCTTLRYDARRRKRTESRPLLIFY